MEEINPDFLTDESNLKASPDNITGVLFPKDESCLVEILQEAHEMGELVTIQGAQSGLTGAAVPISGGLIINLQNYLSLPNRPGFEREGKILRKDNEIIVPSGLTLSSLERTLSTLGLWYQPNPTELSAQIGGTIATNASGSRTFSFGPTRNHVTYLKVILANGDTLSINRGEVFAKDYKLDFSSDSGTKYSVSLPKYRMFEGKNAAGLHTGEDLDLIDLFIGSEGILGVISEVGLKAYEKRDISTGMFFFPNDGMNFANAARDLRYNGEKGILSLEYFDQRALSLANTSTIPNGANSAVMYEYFEDDSFTPSLLLHFYEISGAIDGWEDSRIKMLRHSVPEAINRTIKQHQTRKIATDFATSPEKFSESFAAYKRVQEEFDSFCGNGKINSALFGHLGDYHLHLNLIPRNQGELEAAIEIHKQLFQEIVSLGGTVSAEHGVGKKQISGKPYLFQMYGEEGLEEIANVKKVLDPNFRLNRGNMVPYQ